MKKRVLSICILLAFAISLALPGVVFAEEAIVSGDGMSVNAGQDDLAVGLNAVAVTGVSLDKASVTLSVGAEETLIATVAPTDATNQDVTWSSSDPAIATVDGGKVIGVKAGTATITVTTEDGGYTANCVVTVQEPVVAVTGVSLNKTSATLSVGAEETLIATVAPANAPNQDVTWSSSDPAIATVDGGKVSGVKAGTATITVTTEDGGYTANCAVTVQEPAVAVTGVSLNKTSATLNVGAEETLIATVAPANATNQDVTWSSSDPAIATVDGGKVIGVKAGTATITVTTEDGGYTANCVATVQKPVVAVTDVSLDKTSVTLNVGAEETLIASVTPANATNQNVIWSSSDPDVATVDNGKVKAVAAGSATITVKTEDGNKTASCAVSVKQLMTKIDMPLAQMLLRKGGSVQVLTTVYPSDTSNTKLIWKSSDERIAVVNSRGVVRALRDGKVTITAKAADGSGVSAKCKIFVRSNMTPATKVSFSQSTLKLYVNKSVNMNATITPADATSKALVWTSSDTSIVTVTQKGKITAVGGGTAIVTAKATDGSGQKAVCKIRVLQPIKRLVIPSNATVTLGRKIQLPVKIVPTNANNRELIWYSEDTRIAKVDSNGYVRGFKKGTTYIKVKAADGSGARDSCKVVVV